MRNVMDMPSRTEGQIARGIEEETSKLPSDIFLWTALGSMIVGGSLLLKGKQPAGSFFASLAPAVLILGLYNKVVKVAGHDKYDEDDDL